MHGGVAVFRISHLPQNLEMVIPCDADASLGNGQCNVAFPRFLSAAIMKLNAGMFRNKISKTTRVDVWIARGACVACAMSFLVWVFAFALLLAFLERVDLHLVVIIRTCSISS